MRVIENVTESFGEDAYHDDSVAERSEFELPVPIPKLPDDSSQRRFRN